MSTPKQYLSRYWGIIALVFWGGIILAASLLRFDPYGIDETAARALLTNWAVADRIVNPIVTLGAPDFRALIFLPLGAYWPGSFIALKVFMLLIVFGGVTLLYKWAKQNYDSETALLASGLMLISPLMLMQVNTVGAGPFLVLGFAVGAWLNTTYRNSGKQLSGWYFAQMLLAVTLVTLHPAGIAYSLALAWEWRKDPIDQRQKKQIIIGISIATIFAILVRFGWPALEWFHNPLLALGAMIQGRVAGDPIPQHWGGGIIPLILIAMVLFFGRKTLMENIMSRMLAVAVVIGAVAADYSWTYLAMALVLYCGTPLLIQLNGKLGKHNFAGQRGVVMLVLFICATLFMMGDRNQRSSIINGTLEPEDQIIKALATETADSEESFNTISQWPARTMLALKHPVFPLPPEAETPEQFLKMIGKVSYIVFDPFDPKNKGMRGNIASLTQEMETVIQQPEGVVVKVREYAPKTNTAQSSSHK